MAGSDPLAVEPQHRMDAGVSVALMMIMGIYAQAIYFPHAHSRLLWIMLCSVLAYALWQQLEARLPWLLDPVDRPPRRLNLSDGALAAMGFMFVQGFIGMLLSTEDGASAQATLIAFSSAGVITASSALWLFWRNALPDLLRATGLRPAEGWRRALPRNLAWGAPGGLLAALLCAGYFAVLRHFPLLEPDMPAPDMPLPILATLVVIAAPLTEEFIFRGLLFAGLRSTVPVAWAIPASAAIFALIHPTLGVVPVFVLGCITAIAYQRTGWLLAPMVAHGIYNAALLI